MSFEKLDYVMAVAQEQNLTKAAAKLYISQPALTNALNKLENELGVKLFDRRHPPIKLTPAGNLYIQEMSRIRQMQLKMQTQLTALSRPQFRLSIGSGRGHYWLPILLPAFHRLHPEVRLIINGGPLTSYEEAFDSTVMDMGIGTLSLSNQDLETEPLITEKLLYVIPRSLGLIPEGAYEGCSITNPLVIDASVLDGSPFVCAESVNNYSQHLETEMSRYHFRYGDLMVYSTPQAALLLASGGMGIAFISQSICEWEQIQSRFDVYFCTLSPSVPTQSIRVFYPRNSSNRPLVADMISLIHKEIIPRFYPAGNY